MPELPKGPPREGAFREWTREEIDRIADRLVVSADFEVGLIARDAAGAQPEAIMVRFFDRDHALDRGEATRFLAALFARPANGTGDPSQWRELLDDLCVLVDRLPEPKPADGGVN